MDDRREVESRYRKSKELRTIVLHVRRYTARTPVVLAAKGAKVVSIPLGVETPLCGARGGIMMFFADAHEQPTCKNCLRIHDRNEAERTRRHVGTWDKKPCPRCGSRYHVPTTTRPKERRPTTLVSPAPLSSRRRDERQEGIDRQRKKQGWDKVPTRRRR